MITVELFAVTISAFLLSHAVISYKFFQELIKFHLKSSFHHNPPPPAALNGNARALQAFSNNLSHSPDLETSPHFS